MCCCKNEVYLQQYTLATSIYLQWSPFTIGSLLSPITLVLHNLIFSIPSIFSVNVGPHKISFDFGDAQEKGPSFSLFERPFVWAHWRVQRHDRSRTLFLPSCALYCQSAKILSLSLFGSLATFFPSFSRWGRTRAFSLLFANCLHVGVFHSIRTYALFLRLTCEALVSCELGDMTAADKREKDGSQIESRRVQWRVQWVNECWSTVQSVQ